MWLAFYLPSLPLQAFSRSLIESAPVAIFERDARRNRIVARNQKASRLGVAVGQSLAEANALTESLVSLVREPLRETALLQRLAEQTSELTPNVHIDQNFGVLLEITASVTLFGGLAALQQRAHAIAATMSLRAHVIVAPTASGAKWLARAHRQLIVERNVGEWLDDLMLDCTDIVPDVIEALRALNLHHLGAVRSIPAAALGKRFDKSLPLLLGRAYGEFNESLPYWQPDVRFSEIVEFPDLAREQPHWMPGVEQLLMALQDFLQRRAVQRKRFCSASRWARYSAPNLRCKRHTKRIEQATGYGCSTRASRACRYRMKSRASNCRVNALKPCALRSWISLIERESVTVNGRR